MLMRPHHLHYLLIFCAFLFVVQLEKTANSRKIENVFRMLANIAWILSWTIKRLQYFHVPIAYQIQQIIYKTMGVSILVSIFKHDSNTHWRKEGWGHLTSIFSWFYYIHYVWPLYIAASSNFAPGIAIKSLTAANGHKYCVNFILDDKMLQNFMFSCCPHSKHIRVSDMLVCCHLS